MGKFLTGDVSIGYVLVQRDEEDPEKKAKFYYEKLPSDISERQVYLVDPMLGTGNSSIMCLEQLQEKGVDTSKVRFVNLVSCPEGLKALEERFSGVDVYTVKVDSHLNDSKYIVPGLGDFGDRYYGTC